MGRFFRQTQSVKLAAFIFGAAVAQMALPNAAAATDCNLSGLTGMNFGNTSSINSNMSVTVSGTVTCSGYPGTVTRGNALPFCLSVFPADSVDADIAVRENARPIWLNGQKGTADSKAIKFNFYMANYSDCPNCIWGGGSGPLPNYGTGYPAFGNPSKSGGGRTSDPVNMAIQAASGGGQDIAAGSYTGSFRLRLNWDDSQGSGANRTPGGKVLPSALCDVGRSPIAGATHTQEKWYNMTVAATVKQACNLQVTGGIAFQPNISLNKVPPTQGGVQVSCNAGALSYQVGISKGNYADAYGTRSMRCENSSACGATQIQYLLFRDAGYTQLWDDNFGGPNVLSGSCPAGGNCVRNIPVYAKVVPRPDVPAGPYRDQVTVTLQPVAN